MCNRETIGASLVLNTKSCSLLGVGAHAGAAPLPAGDRLSAGPAVTVPGVPWDVIPE